MTLFRIIDCYFKRMHLEKKEKRADEKRKKKKMFICILATIYIYSHTHVHAYNIRILNLLFTRLEGVAKAIDNFHAQVFQHRNYEQNRLIALVLLYRKDKAPV